MSTLKPDSTFNSSAASSQVDSGEDMDSIKVKNYVKDLLRSRIFLGRYLERRLSDERVGYRDVVLISPAEVELKRDLMDVVSKLRAICSIWIGITEGEFIGYSGVCLWTEIDNQPFGPFWFQIRSVKFREAEIIVTVKCIRAISETFIELEPILTGSPKRKATLPSTIQAVSTEALSETYTDFVETLKTALSIRNVKEFITFICAFVIAVFTGSTAFVNFLGNFILALIRETSILIRNSTPLMLGFLDFLSKIVGGFYILVAMFFKPSNPVPPDRRSITYSEKSRRSHRLYDDNIDNSFPGSSFD